MTGAHNFFRRYALVICDHAPAQRNVEDFDFVSEVPHSNHHTVGTASWQNHDSSSPQSAIILHCHVCLCLSNHNISSTLWGQWKSKNTAHLPGYEYPRPAQGLGWSSGYKWLAHYIKPMRGSRKCYQRGSNLATFFNGRIQIPLYKRAIIGPPVKRHLNGDSLACRWWLDIECLLGSFDPYC